MISIFSQAKEKILLIGGSGLVGQHLYRELIQNNKYDVFILDQHNSLEVENFIQGDICDYASISHAIKKMNVVIYLAAAKEEESLERIKAVNIDGTKNVFQACKEGAVKRIVFVSTIEVIHACRFDEPYFSIHEGHYESVPDQYRLITPSEVFLPGKEKTSENLVLYAESKLFGESLAKQYASEKMSCICVRLGWVNENDDPFNHDDLTKTAPGPNWCSKEDAVQMLKRCIEVKDIIFDVFYAVSNFKYRYLSLENAQKKLGYQPRGDIDEKIENRKIYGLK